MKSWSSERDCRNQCAKALALLSLQLLLGHPIALNPERQQLTLASLPHACHSIIMLSLYSAAASFAPATAPVATATRAAVSMATKEDLAASLNPVLGYYDPLRLGSAAFWNESQEATYGFLRQAEIKHGRVAMFAFCGYIAQANGLTWPNLLGVPTTGATPAEQWFNLPIQGRVQIVLFIGFLEWWGEFGGQGHQHYMRGGKPGVYPPFKDIPFHKAHLNRFSLYDPLGIAAKNSPEKKASGLLKEINNGRLAMIGIMGFLAEAKVPGSVPGLTGLIKPEVFDTMGPFA